MLLRIAKDEMEHWEDIIRQDTRLCCEHISDVEGDEGTFSGGWDGGDHDGRNGLFDRLTIWSRYAAQLERGETGFEVTDEELPALKHILCAQMQGEGWLLSEETDELSDSPLLMVACQSRMELLNSLADQIGGLF
jgi:hypothetical protein